MKARFNIYGIPVEIISAEPQLLKLFVDELKPFEANGQWRQEGKIQLILKKMEAPQTEAEESIPWIKYRNFVSNRFLSSNALLTGYGKNQVMVMADRKERKIEARIEMDPSLLPDPIYHRCFTQPISLWFKEKGLFFLHAGCVSEDGRGILIVGKSKVGKSTLSIAAVRAGFKFLGDEQPILSASNSRIQANFFPRQIRLDVDVAKLFPGLSYLVRLSKSNRLIFPIEKIWPKCVVPSCIPAVMIFPKFDSKRKMNLKRLHPTAGLTRLLKDDYFVLYQRDKWSRLSRRHIELFEQLIQQTVSYELVYGTSDIPKIPAFFRKLL